jgi:hypothetical protein
MSFDDKYPMMIFQNNTSTHHDFIKTSENLVDKGGELQPYFILIFIIVVLILVIIFMGLYIYSFKRSEKIN